MKSYKEYSNLKDVKKIKPLPTFSIPLTILLSGGTAEGRWFEVVGAEGLGKTTLTTQLVGNNLLDDKDTYLMFIDAEISMVTDDGKNRFLDILPFRYTKETHDIYLDDNLLYIDGKERGVILPIETYNELYDEINNFAKFLIDNKKKGIIIWDSLTQLTTEEMQKGSKQLGVKAKYIQLIIDTYNSTFYKIPITLYVINQIRAKLVINPFAGKDKSEGDMSDIDFSITGGYAHRFIAFQSLVLVKGRKYKYPKSGDNTVIDGKIVEFHLKKNKFGRSDNILNMVFIPEIGFSDILTSLYHFEEDGLIKSANFIKIEKITGNKSYKLIPFVEELLSNNELMEKFIEFTYYYFADKLKSKDKVLTEDKMNYFKEKITIDCNKVLFYLSQRENVLELEE